MPRGDDLDFMVELDKLDRPGLLTTEAQERYCVYRRRNLSPKVAYDAAIRWQENMIEQRIRRFSHDTGNEGGEHEIPSDRLPDRPGTGLRVRRWRR